MANTSTTVPVQVEIAKDEADPPGWTSLFAATLEQEEIDREMRKWRSALIVYVIGDTPGYNYMSKFVTQTWNKVVEPEVFLHKEGYYVIKFQSVEDMNEILFSGPYTINNKPMILKQWTVNFDLSKKFPTKIPLWVTLPHLPMSCWSCQSLSKIPSLIGKPLYADECTSKQRRISCAQILVEINITRPLPDKVLVSEPNGTTFEQAISYDWKPEYCPKCLKIGNEWRSEDGDGNAAAIEGQLVVTE
ncbi:uncharacterized protein LOC132053789 [Lycium ferocissimum]|uniref:uncharacterized protein LOC132053789 n=1 Tax=Lycium ferocissimum TaxID=112874 RepID=UPI00281666A5|nr:uncharacterized protein LOC132053789 [Lycium ferocissimum]